ncbi:MAG TPA: 5'-nucleotidase C-terminal domain-containing protein [Sedimentibacter sp.]|jgi:5'-nucleotidase|nr:5'-nucleotidase C-terminal domain-containing protein [Sedimentibacter sp.]NLA14108.1 LysM peptidoglycan-binding domain-containing protein [Tissierellia bacterium]HOA19419.1 5'-nucleotidase C-terminal domain-containing protein [Sedimentibacter sp.]HPB79764.1 5'-nucleotidase C-terminal domain-containing protein [Sedimentibacter sp.]HPY55809.1 5'-nucleotidase C-terminal domain-containing protein [Sedimentibacter sp.]
MKKVLSLVLVVLLILSSFSFVFAEDAETVKITVIHTNDTHSRLIGTNTEIGFAKIATLIKEAKEANPNTLVLDAGDTLHGMPIVNISKGENAIKVLEAAGYDYMTLGNHDFNYGKERLFELRDMSQVGMLSANIVDENGEYIFTPYVIEEVGDVKVGIYGLSTPDTVILTNPNNVVGLVFKDPIEVSKEMVEELEDKTDVIIALAHLGLDESSTLTSKALAQEVEGIDLIIDGHSHSMLEGGQLENNTLIVQTKNYGQNLGYVDIEILEGEVTGITARLLAAADTADVVPDPDLQKIIEDIEAANAEVFNEVIATTGVYLDGVRENVRTKETNLGNLSADAARAATGADIAFVNGGGIREDIPVGDITKGKIAAIFPFGNTIEVKKITGADLKAMLEWSVSDYPAAKGAFLQVSGLEFTFDPAKEIGSKVVEILVGGEAFDEAKEYTVAINDFMSTGGDGYAMLADYDVLAIYGTYEEIIIDYLVANGTAGSEVSGRIKVMETVVEEPEPVEPEPVEPAPVEPEPVEVVIYIVVPGDVLWKIAAKYNLTYQELAEYNNIANPHLIFPDQVIKVPSK